MPRRPRVLFPHAIYHVMTRGNRRATIFEEDDDRHQFLSGLMEASERYVVEVYAYCLMGTHYHLVVTTPRANLPAFMRQLNGVFAQSSNRRHRRTGHLFEGRFRAFVVQRQSYLRRAVRYVVLNPVRARLVSEPSAWPWSSCRAMIGLAAAPSFLRLDWMDEIFGGGSREIARRQFAEYVTSPVQRSTPINVNAPVFGSKTFQTTVLTRAVREATRVPRRWLPTQRPRLEQLLKNGQMSRSSRNDAIWEAHARHGYCLCEIAKVLELHPSTIGLVIRNRREVRRPTDALWNRTRPDADFDTGRK